jgi:hypothetical protein
MSDPAPSPQPRRPWVWIRRLLFLHVLILGPLLAWKWWQLQSIASQGHQDLEAAIVETDALDPRWRWDDLEAARPVVPASRNSIPLILRVDALLAGPLPQWTALFHAVPGFPDDLPPNRLPGPDSRAYLERILAGQEPAVALAVTLRDHSEGRAAVTLATNPMQTPLWHLQPCTNVAGLLEIEIERRLQQGETHAAAEGLHALLHVGASLRGEGFLESQVTRVEIRTAAVRRVERLLGMSEPDEATLASLQAHLSAEAAEFPILVGLRGERSHLYTLFEGLRSGTLSYSGWCGVNSARGFAVPARHVVSWVYSHGLAGEQAGWLHVMNKEIATHRYPPHEQEAARKEIYRVWRDAPGGARIPVHDGHLLRVLIPQRSWADAADALDRSSLALAIVALAAERFRRVHQRWPETLAELVPIYLPEVPIDPNSGQPLEYQRRVDGARVHSVRKQRRGDEPLQNAEETRPSDRTLRLWDPPRRRLPPDRIREAVPPHLAPLQEDRP